MDKNKILTLFAIIVFVGAVLIQYSQNEIPSWLLTALSTALMYVFGLHTDNNKSGDE